MTIRNQQGSEHPEQPNASVPAGGSDQSVRLRQITIRLDPGTIADARQIAARKGIGHHILLRLWVQEGINRAYQEGLLPAPPRGWRMDSE